MKKLLLLFGMIACWIWSSGELQAQNFNDTTAENCIATTGGQVTLTFTNPPPASSPVTIIFYYRGDLNGTSTNPEKFDFYDENSNLLGTSKFQSTQCDPNKDTIMVTVPASTYNGWLADGQVDFLADADATVSSTLAACAPWGGSCAQVEVDYISTSGNCPDAFSNFTMDSISGTAAKIDWVPGTGNNSFYLEYGPAGFTPGSGTSVTGTYPGTQPPVILTGLSAQTTYDVYFGEICNSGADSVYFASPLQLTTTKLCAPPDSLAASNVLSSSVDLSWNYAGTAQSFDVIYGPTGFNPATGGSSVTTSSGSPYTLTGLTPATFYDAYLVAYCGPSDGYSDTIGPVNFLTLCVLKTLPYIEDFSGGVFPPCWSRSSTTDVQFLASCASRNNVLEILQQEDATTADIDVSGVLNQNLEVSYYIGAGACNNNPEDEDFIVEYWDGSQWVEAIRYNGDQMPNAFVRGSFFVQAGQFGHPFKVRFNMLEGTTDTWQVDSVVVEQGPACLNPTAQQVSFNSIDSNQATVFIGDSISDLDYEWGPCGFTQGTGTFGTDSLGTANLTGLSPNTCYDVFLRRDCDTSGISPWAGPFSFTTQCGFLGAPYSQNFDGTTEPEIDNCWTAIGHGQSGAEVQTENFRNNSAPNGLEIHNSSNTSGFVGIATPAFYDLDNTKRIKFWTYDEDGSFDGSDLIIGTMSNPLDPSTFTPYDTITEGDMDDDAWEFFIVEFDNYTGTDKYIVFRHGMNTTFDNIHIDDFVYEPIPACVPPIISGMGTALVTANTAEVFWGSGSDGDETHIEWGSPGFAPGTGAALGSDSVAGAVDTFNITGLASQTTYEFYIRDSCVADGFSPWIGPVSFTTACAALPTPHTESFDNTSIPACWSTYSSTGETWNFGTNTYAPSSDHTGNGGYYANVDDSEAPSSPDVTLESPLFDVSGLTNPELTFFLASTDATVTLSVDVWDGSSWNTGVFSQAAASSSTWESIVVNLAPFAGSGEVAVRFVIDEQNGSFQNDVSIDDVTIASGPSCPSPIALSVSNLSDIQATANWAGGPSANSYQVWYGPQGFYQGTQTTSGGLRMITSNDTLQITGLTELTCYEFLVRAICGPGDTSAWVGPVSFCTEPSCPAPTNLNLINATDVTANISFTGGGASDFNIVYGAPGFIPSAGSANYSSVTTTTPALSGLTPNTPYDVYVRDSCAAGDVSVWVGPISFYTACTPFTAPYSEDFENHTLGFYQGQDNCWFLQNTEEKTSATSGYGWDLRNTQQTSSTGTGADRDATLWPTQGGQFFNADVSYGSTGDSSMLISPVIDITPLSNPELEYNVHRYGTGMADFYVDIFDGTQWINGVHSYTNPTGIQSSPSDAWTDTIIDLAPYSGITNFQVRFRTVSNGCCAGDNGLDDVRISDPISGDLDLVEAEFLNGPCLSANDSIKLYVVNAVNTTVDFSTYPLNGNYDVSGPVNSTGSFNVNTGSLPGGDTLEIFIGGIDLSMPGTYTLEAYIDTSYINVFRNRDTLTGITLDILPEFEANPKTVILPSANDSVEICIESSFFGGGELLITEVMHFKTGTGAPTGGWPSWHNADEHIEITGVPNADIGGVTFEQWNISGSTPDGSYTFPPGTLLGPNGTATIAMQSVTPSPSDFYYDGSGGNTTNWQSGGGQGVILRDASGNIIDAVGYGSSAGTYTFPAAAGVTPADWTGATPSASGTCGIRLIGADMNDPSTWVVSSSTNPQDPNVVNTGVPQPQSSGAPGLTWTQVGSSTVIDTLPCIMVGPYTSGGSYQYVANYSNACGTYTDTVTVIVPNCSAPSNIGGSALSASSVEVTWDSTGTGATNFDIEYGPAGFTIGNGTRVSATGNSYAVTGLAANLCQEFYVRAACSAMDTSAWIGPVSICPDVNLCDDLDAYASGGPISDQSALFIPWQGAAGDEVVSTTYANSSPNSLRVYDSGPAGFVDVVAYFDTISSGAWNVTFDMYIPSGMAGYYNIQQNHSLTGVGNLWGGEVYFQANGLAEVQYSTGTVVAGTFNYNQGQWFTMNTVIDLNNDTIWFEMNGSSTGVGYNYSLANAGSPLQFNGVNFYSGVLGTDQADYYMDNFCITPYSAGPCPAPTSLDTANLTCTSVDLSWSSSSSATTSIVEYGPAGFAPGTGAGTIVLGSSPISITGLSAGTAYDFYVTDSCANDTSQIAGPETFTTPTGPISAAFSTTYGTPGASSRTAFFDASSSQGANSYSWDFGDGSTGSGMNTSNIYNSNGSYYVCLTVTGECGTDSICDSVTVEGISLQEHIIANTLAVYPNPTKGRLQLSFTTDQSDDIEIEILDLSGKLVKAIQVEDQVGKYERELDISNLADGTYMLKLQSSETTVIRRIVKE